MIWMIAISFIGILLISIEVMEIKKGWIADARARRIERHRYIYQKLAEELAREPDVPRLPTAELELIDRAIDIRASARR